MAGRSGSRARLWGAGALVAYAISVAGVYAWLWRRGRGLFGARVSGAERCAGDAVEAPLVSVIVPARNEERNIRGCVESLLAQDYPAFEVIVVDDGSTDATPRLLAELAREAPGRERLRALRVETLPPGWAGKPHTVHAGALAARGEWLLFTDADTRHAPDALRAALGVARARRLDFLSFVTRQELLTFWERTLMPLAYMGVSMRYSKRLLGGANAGPVLVNGQHILVRAATYWSFGGYGSPELRGTILDDSDLAIAVKRAGGRLQFVDGRDYVTTRMYTTLGEHWEGWGKTAYLGSGAGPRLYVTLMLGLPIFCVGPFALLLAGLLARRRGWTLAGAVPVAATVAYRSWLDRELRVPWPYAWTHPLASLVGFAILLTSFWRTVSGRGVTWRGRVYVGVKSGRQERGERTPTPGSRTSQSSRATLQAIE